MNAKLARFLMGCRELLQKSIFINHQNVLKKAPQNKTQKKTPLTDLNYVETRKQEDEEYRQLCM